jgi:hypothetical protein
MFKESDSFLTSTGKIIGLGALGAAGTYILGRLCIALFS